MESPNGRHCHSAESLVFAKLHVAMPGNRPWAPRSDTALQGFVPLPKSEAKSRIEENADVFDFELDTDDMQSLDTGMYQPCTWDPTVSND